MSSVTKDAGRRVVAVFCLDRAMYTFLKVFGCLGVTNRAIDRWDLFAGRVAVAFGTRVTFYTGNPSV